MTDVKIRYYRVIRGRGYWQPTPSMQAVGFLPVPCGPDGPSAWAIAEARNRAWQDYRNTGARPNTSSSRQSGYVYFLQIGNAVKIGFSTNPFRRISKMDRSSSVPSLFVSVPGTRYDEKTLHRRLDAYRRNGEWFTASGPVQRVIVRSVAFGRPMHDGADGPIREQKLEHLA